MRFPDYVMVLKETIQTISRDSFRFKPSPRYACERFQARIAAEKAKGIAPKAIFPLGVSPRCTNWKRVAQSAPPLNVRYKEKSDSAGSIATIVRPAVTSSTPAIRFPCHGARASRLPRK
jgi:hypothetical protein